MRVFPFTLAVWWLALWVFGCVPTAPAAESIEREPVYRSVSPHWTDLGRADFPFKALYVDDVVMGGGGLVRLSDITNAWSSGWVAGGATNVISGLVLSNGFAGWDGTLIGGVCSVLVSTDGAHWSSSRTNVAVTVAINIEVGSVDGANGISNLVIWTWTAPGQFGKTNYIFSQHLLSDNPRLPQDVANRRWVQGQVGGVTSRGWSGYPAGSQVNVAGSGVEMDSVYQWVTDRGANYAGVNLLAGGQTVIQARSLQVWGHVNWMTRVGNAMRAGVVNSVAGVVPTMEECGDMGNPQWSRVSGVSAVNGGAQWTLSWSSGSGQRFYRAVFPSGVVVTVPAQLSAGSVLSTNGFWSPTLTVSAATNTTWGFGAGLMVCDTNYVYVSVGTNRWKRAAVSAW